LPQRQGKQYIKLQAPIDEGHEGTGTQVLGALFQLSQELPGS
jgi:hypothetical protein